MALPHSVSASPSHLYPTFVGERKPKLLKGCDLGDWHFLIPHEMGGPKDGRDPWLAPARWLGEAETEWGSALP
ncbi:hypothetical protein X773_19090 [Mesorhizobium sp. LSJC285A00]|nr:hypothetical protein X773_19090 [Mesorhizobium sp. LSJC285A00]